MIARSRIVSLVAALLCSCAAPGGMPVTPLSASPSSEATDSRPKANVHGRDVREQTPDGSVVLPQSPLYLVVEDCDGLEFFEANTAWHPVENLLVLDWWDAGAADNRTLTILADSPSCRAHEGVRRLTSS